MPDSIKEEWLSQGLTEKGWESLPSYVGRMSWSISVVCMGHDLTSRLWLFSYVASRLPLQPVHFFFSCFMTTLGCWGPRRSEIQFQEIKVVRRMILTGTRKSYDLIRSSIWAKRLRNTDNCEEILTLSYPVKKTNSTQLRLEKIFEFKKAAS